MHSRVKDLFEARAKIFKALAHPTRLFIVNELSRQEKCVGELTQMIGDDISTVSKHLSILRNAEVVVCEKRGGRVFCTLRFPCILNFFSCVESVLEKTAEEKLNLVK